MRPQADSVSRSSLPPKPAAPQRPLAAPRPAQFSSWCPPGPKILAPRQYPGIQYLQGGGRHISALTLPLLTGDQVTARELRRDSRAMIVLFTDFGVAGPYVGQVEAVLQQTAPGVPVIQLFADAPRGQPKPSAYLLAAYASWFPTGSVFLCVVDPGVGSDRKGLVVEANGRRFVGPD